jgi:hypothetical protein
MSLAKRLQRFAGSFANNFSLGINAFTAQESCGDFGRQPHAFEGHITLLRIPNPLCSQSAGARIKAARFDQGPSTLTAAVRENMAGPAASRT